MDSGDLQVRRLDAELCANSRRVITRFFEPGPLPRLQAIIGRVCTIPDQDVTRLCQQVLRDFGSRHRDLEGVFRAHFAAVQEHIPAGGRVSDERALLLGAYFTLEYSIESVALFNPSMVPHPDQSGVADGELRFVLSLRACGEGHVSSIEFRSGVVTAAGDVRIDPATPYAATERPMENRTLDKCAFKQKLIEMNSYEAPVDRVLDQLSSEFTVVELRLVLERLHWSDGFADRFHSLAQEMLWLARSTYELEFPADSELSERVIFPVTENESRGIEDARFVRFDEGDGRAVYYATYTAYNGVRTLPQMMSTTDFRRFSIDTLSGSCVKNKGMALFPRKLNGRYVMLARLDGENLYVLSSDRVAVWNESQRLSSPAQPWELVQVGNCGSPIETPRGWLVITHGVGPMRRYCLGALLLAIDDPSRVIGSLREPLIVPKEDERDGYVPNVVYSCGGMILGDTLILPYAVADTSTRFAVFSVSQLLARLTKG